MHEEHGFNWVSLVPGLNHLPIHVAMTLVVSAVLLVTTFVARGQLLRTMRAPGGGLVPDETMTYKNFFELVAEGLYGLTESVLGHHDAPLYFPLIGSLFIFILTSNLMGLIPGLLPPTDNFNTTLALGIFVFIYYNFVGIKAHGAGYAKHFFGPVWWLAPLFVIIEIFSHVFRPLSLALRLKWNIVGDHVVMGVFSGLAPYFVPIIFYGLGLFVAFLQAFVFCLMTMVYIQLSSSHDH
jgi:F-type H+-transporting ATPase subunit a